MVLHKLQFPSIYGAKLSADWPGSSWVADQRKSWPVSSMVGQSAHGLANQPFYFRNNLKKNHIVLSYWARHPNVT